ncbi:MAG: SUMF1/EgtB/PvdO family nonheme iron enzyme [Polyangiaceae bacterium]|nr:SUMF1/EgtB/PvdO family nonheme iron enzyme [Polyangiaceae bacterium]
MIRIHGPLPRRRALAGATLSAALALCLLPSCVSRPSVSRRVALPAEGDRPERVEIAAAHVELGFATGVLRSTVNVGGFAISRHPITLGQFSACVRAGACQAEANEGDCFSVGGSPVAKPNLDEDDVALPAVCVTVAQATAHCSWLGGRLPTIAEWMLASRGPAVSRYAWGSSVPTCDQHPNAPARVDTEEGTAPAVPESACAASTEELPALFRVGRHPEGKAASGVEDVLLTRGELLTTSSSSPYNACSPPYSACVVYGLKPGAIDSVIPAGINLDFARPRDQLPAAS